MEPLQPKLVDGLRVSFIEAVYPSVNTSGLEALGKTVLIKCDKCAEVTRGGILLTENDSEKLTAGVEMGCIFGVGEGAFRVNPDGTRWTTRRPAEGDRVYFLKYSGVQARGRDGDIYRIMDESCIGALILPDAEFETKLREAGVLAEEAA